MAILQNILIGRQQVIQQVTGGHVLSVRLLFYTGWLYHFKVIGSG